MDDTQPISVDDTVEPAAASISVDASPSNNVPLLPEIAASRASKVHYGLGVPLQKSYEDIYRSLTSGREQQLRDEAASRVNYFQKQQLADTLLNYSRQKGGPLTEQDTDYITRTVEQAGKTISPDVVFETAFAKKYIEGIYSTYGGAPSEESKNYSFFDEALKQIPDQVKQNSQVSEDLISFRDYVLTRQQNLRNTVTNQSWLGWGADQAKLMFQPYVELKLRGQVQEVSKLSGLLGSNLDEQSNALWRMPADQRRATFSSIMDKLEQDNPSAAEYFAAYVARQGTSAVTLDNVFTVLALPDIYTGGKFAASLAKKLYLYNQTRQAFKTLVRSSAATDVQPIKVVQASGLGDLPEAAIQKSIAEHAHPNPPKDSIESLPTFLDADMAKIEANPGRYGQEGVNRIIEATKAFKENFNNVITNVSKILRIPAVLATEKAMRAIAEDLKGQFPGIRNSILDVRYSHHDPITTNHWMETVIGTNDAGYFSDAETALGRAQFHQLSNYTIKQDGFQHYISILSPLRETDNVVRDYLFATKASQTPYNWKNSFLSWIRTPEETLSEDQRMARKVATYAPSVLMEVAKDTAKPIRDLARFTSWNLPKRSRWNQWERAVGHARDIDDPVTGKRGYFFQSPGELEEYYQNAFQRLPNQAEIDGYFAYRRLVDMDHELRNISLYKMMTRVGTEKHSFYVLGKDGNSLKSPFFNGIKQREFPGGEDTILIMGDRLGEERLHLGGSVPKIDEWRNKVKNGEYSVIRIYDPERRPLQAFGDKIGQARVRYVIAKNFETAPLDYSQLPRRGGGHFDYDNYNFYIKQANVRPENIGKRFKHWYEGDTTLHPIDNRAMGIEYIKHLNQVRTLLSDDKIAEARAYALANKLPYEWKELKSWFYPTKSPEGHVLPPRFSMSEPFQVVPANKMIIDMDDTLEKRYPKTFQDGTRRGSDARQYQVQYTGERDAHEVYSLQDKGSLHNPVYTIEPAKLVDPFPSINRALSRIVNSTFMDDYKISSVEHWLEEAKPYLKVEGDIDEIRRAPFWHFNNPTYRRGADAQMVSQLKANWFKIRQFTGIQNATDTFLHSAAQQLADTIYNKFGPSGEGFRKVLLAPVWALGNIQEPWRFTRSMVFNMKMGLFSVPQFFVHAMTYVNVMGIAGPKNAGSGAMAAMLHGWSRINRHPAILEHMDGLMSKMGWRPGEFKEAFNEVRYTGFLNEAGEYALRDDVMSNRVVSVGVHKVLDSGQMFFRGGVRSLRAGSWYTAYREFRDLHPTGAIGIAERNQILERADILSHNMTRASNSMLHTGILSIPAQFYTYFLRLTELMTGKRLSKVEKIRLFGVNAAVFGFPAATGLYGYPWGDTIRKYAQENGYVVGDNFITSLMMEGGPSALIAAATGDGDPSKGHWYNIGNRYGPEGLATVGEFLDSDEPAWKLFGGAAFSTLSNMWGQSSGFRQVMLNAIKGEAFPPKPEDISDMFKEVSSFNYALRGWVAINTGKWLNKNEATLSKDITPLNAMFKTLTGLQDQQETDVWTKSLTIKNRKDLEKQSLAMFIKEFHRALQAHDNKDHEQGKAYFTRAFTYLINYPDEKIHSAVALATKDYETMVQRIDWDYYTKDVPKNKKATMFNALQRTLKLGN